MSLKSRILSAADPSQVEGLMRFFKTGPGQYGEGDRFLGIKVPVTRAIVKECWRETSFDELEECIASEYHELRLAALLCLVEIFSHVGKRRGAGASAESIRQRCIDFYLGHTRYINNWDLVDLSCYPLLGEWLLGCPSGGALTHCGAPSEGCLALSEGRGAHSDEPCALSEVRCSLAESRMALSNGSVLRTRQLLYDLAQNGTTIWERRIGIVSTMTFVRNGQLDDTYALAEIFLKEGFKLHDLLQKAVGWLLREAGKRDPERLLAWLREHGAGGARETSPRSASGACAPSPQPASCAKPCLPRTMLRYAIEKFPPELRAELLRVG